jgi:hypothetical protein
MIKVIELVSNKVVGEFETHTEAEVLRDQMQAAALALGSTLNEERYGIRLDGFKAVEKPQFTRKVR